MQTRYGTKKNLCFLCVARGALPTQDHSQQSPHPQSHPPEPQLRTLFLLVDPQSVEQDRWGESKQKPKNTEPQRMTMRPKVARHHRAPILSTFPWPAGEEEQLGEAQESKQQLQQSVPEHLCAETQAAKPQTVQGCQQQLVHECFVQRSIKIIPFHIPPGNKCTLSRQPGEWKALHIGMHR